MGFNGKVRIKEEKSETGIEIMAKSHAMTKLYDFEIYQ